MIAISLCMVFAVLVQEPAIAGPDVLRVGHLVEVRGGLDAQGRFLAEQMEIRELGSDDVLIGVVPKDDQDPLAFTILGQQVVADEQTVWQNIERGSLAGTRVKIEGSWKGPRKFHALTIAPRGPGRDRVGGRIDALARVEGGWEARIMIFTLFVADGTEVEHEKPLDQYVLTPESRVTRTDSRRIERDEDDTFGKGIALTDTLRLMGQIETKMTTESNFDIDRGPEEDRTDYDLPVRLRMTWSPSKNLYGLWELRYTEQYRRDEDNGGNDSETNHSGGFGETWLQWRDLMGYGGFDLTVGRQDFDDPREWLFDQNLDAVRLSWIRPDWRLDLATATVIAGGSERDESSFNGIAYLSNNDSDRHLALWTVYRDIDEFTDRSLTPDETSWHFGVRALGEWLPQNNVWADFAYQIADRPLFDAGGTATGTQADVSAWAYDIGTTWSPPFATPLYFMAGYALGQGSSDDGTFRQTGWQDNTDRFGGVTSYQYYGELLNPELSNLGILTLGVGARVAERTSVDFVFHTFTQDETKNEFSPLPQREADIKARPTGLDADLGWEADLVVGFRRFKNLDIEIVGATFEPGDAFVGQDAAYLIKLQLRYRF